MDVRAPGRLRQLTCKADAFAFDDQGGFAKLHERVFDCLVVV